MNTKMPVGMSDFKTVRETCYMVDKTDFIRRLLDNHKSVTLFTRPRRFGKTLTMSMLDYFFSIDKKDVSAELFKGLAIETYGSSYMSHRGQYPVIFITLKDFYNTSWESMYRSFRLFMQSVYAKYIYLLDSSRLSAFEKEGIQRVLSLKAEPEEYQISLQRLAALLYKHYQVRPIILIDEYDAPLQRAYEQHFYEEALPFWKGWFNATLKDNEAVYFAVITGVLRIAKESIFSGLNNLDVFSVLNSQYSDVFGFTNSEITAMARDLGYQDKIGEIKQWYDGYCFGNTEVYNPWSVIQYMDKTGEPQPYWANTAENNILKELLIHAKPQRIHELQRLVQGASVSATLHDSVIYDELLRDDDALYTMLLTTGYLTVQEKSDEIYNRYALRIPNKEINYVYSTEILNTLIHGMSRNDFDGFLMP